MSRFMSLLQRSAGEAQPVVGVVAAAVHRVGDYPSDFIHMRIQFVFQRPVHRLSQVEKDEGKGLIRWGGCAHCEGRNGYCIARRDGWMLERWDH
jgi:hypothetical protein